MANLSEVARVRKASLRQLMLASRRLDAQQERLEREVKRLVNRKRAIPETADADRLAGMAQSVQSALESMATVIQSLANSWGAM